MPHGLDRTNQINIGYGQLRSGHTVDVNKETHLIDTEEQVQIHVQTVGNRPFQSKSAVKGIKLD